LQSLPGDTIVYALDLFFANAKLAAIRSLFGFSFLTLLVRAACNLRALKDG
jgi:hypothetical protein